MMRTRLLLLVGCTLMWVSSTQAEVVTRYDFDEDLLDGATSGSTADDLDPIFVGGTGTVAFEPGVVGQAVRLDLSAGSAFVLTAFDSDDLNLASDWTLEAFVKPDYQNSGEWDRFWTKWGEGSNDWHWAFRYDNNGLDYFMNDGQIFDALVGVPDNSVPLNRWSHVAVVGDSASSSVRGYLNGVEVVSEGYTEPIVGVSNMNFGNFAHGGVSNGLQYTGLIDEALIHDVAVDEAYLQGRAALVPTIEPPGAVTPPPTTGLVSYYTFDDTIEDVASDYGANVGTDENDLTPRDGDVNFEDGRIGRALRIGVDVDDLTDLNAELSDDINLPEIYTIESWVNPSELSDSWQRLVLNWSADEHSYHFAIRNNSGYINGVSLFHGQSDRAESDANGGTVVLDEWQHIAGVADGENLRVYLNGELVGQTAYDGTIFLSEFEGLGIGDSDTALSTIKYNGLLDDLAIWSVPLSPEQIRFQYQQGLLGNGATSGGIPGDFDGSGQLDVADIDQLGAVVRLGNHPPEYDLTQDGLVNEEDRVEWVHNLKSTYFGDAGLNGEFNSSDMVEVFVAGKYETGEWAGWAEGDWNGDGIFSSSDMVTAFADGGYEQGPRTDAAAVPEPGGWLLSLLSVAGLLTVRRR